MKLSKLLKKISIDGKFLGFKKLYVEKWELEIWVLILVLRCIY